MQQSQQFRAESTTEDDNMEDVIDIEAEVSHGYDVLELKDRLTEIESQVGGEHGIWMITPDGSYHAISGVVFDKEFGVVIYA